MFGTEMEYGASSRAADDGSGRQTDISDSSITHVLHHYLPNGIVRLNTMSSNGGRIYNDHSHPEYATPTTTSIWELLAIELGSEEIIRDAFEDWEEAVGNGRVVAINKRVMSDRQSWGYHSSFMFDRRAIADYGSMDRSELMRNPAFKMLGLHLATANLFVGSGGIYGNDDKGYQYVVAQKAMHVTEDFHPDTVSHKPVVNLRDEALADRERFGRLHITSQDANISPWASLMKWGMSVLVIGCMEEGIFPGWQFDLKEGSLCRLAWHVAMDTTCKEPFEFADGKTATALEVQEEMHAAAVLLGKRVELSNELLWVLTEWDKAIADMQQGPDALKNRTDWVARKHMIDRRMAQYDMPDKQGRVGVAHAKARALDLSFDRLTTRRLSLPDTFRSTIWKQYMPPRAVIEHYKTSPPTDTRAVLIARFVKNFKPYDEQGNAHASWDEGVVSTRGIRAVIRYPGDPRETESPDLDLLIHATADPDNMTAEVVRRLRKLARGGIPPQDDWSL